AGSHKAQLVAGAIHLQSQTAIMAGLCRRALAGAAANVVIEDLIFRPGAIERGCRERDGATGRRRSIRGPTARADSQTSLRYVLHRDECTLGDVRLYAISADVECAIGAVVVPFRRHGIQGRVRERSHMKFKGFSNGCRPMTVIFVLPVLKIDRGNDGIRVSGLFRVLTDEVSARSYQANHRVLVIE